MKFDRFRRFIAYYRPHWKLFTIDLGAALTQAVLTVVLPMVVYRVFQVYLPAMDLNRIIGASVVLAVLAGCIALAEYAGIRWGHMLGVRMEADMRRDLFIHLQKLSFSFFDRNKTGHIMSRIANDLTQIAEIAHHCPEDMLIAALTMSGALVMMFHLNPLLAVISLLPLPLVIFWGMVFQRRMHRGFREVRRRVADINSRVENSIQGIREVKSFCNEELEIRRFGEVNGNFRKARENVFGVMAGFHAGMMFLVQGYSLLFIAAGAVLMYYGKAELSEILVFTMYARYFTMPIFRMVSFVEQFQQGATAFERFTEVLDETPEVRDADIPVRPTALTGVIDFNHVFFHYPPETPEAPTPETVLSDISLHIPAGQSVALVGESGAGKTTLAALIPRFYDVSSGAITLDGIDLRHLPQKWLREQIGVVRQTPFLFDATIRENIRFGRELSHEQIVHAATVAQADDFITAFPEGYGHMLSQKATNISGGQKQRLLISRALAAQPDILILDDSSSALDYKTDANLRAAIARELRDTTLVVVAQRVSSVMSSDLILVLDEGEIIGSGTHAELLQSCPVYREISESQMGGAFVE